MAPTDQYKVGTPVFSAETCSERGTQVVKACGHCSLIF